MNNTVIFNVELPVIPTIARKGQIITKFEQVFHRPFAIQFSQRNDGQIWISSNGHQGIGPKTRDKLYKIANAAI